MLDLGIQRIKKTNRTFWLRVLLGLFLLVGVGCSSGTQQPTPELSITPGASINADPSATPDGQRDSTLPSTTPTATETLPPFEPIAVRAADCGYGGELKSIEALDRYTVQFALCYPDTAFLAKLTFPSFGIQSSSWLEETGGGGVDSPLMRQPVGTGAYKLVEWNQGDRLVFEQFSNYWNAPVTGAQTLIFRWNMDPDQRLVELQAGTVDGYDNVASVDFDTIQADSDLVLAQRAPLSVAYLGMNNQYAPFDNETVRQAIAMALDRQQILEEFFPKGYAIATHFTPCVFPNGCVGEPWYTFDPQHAQQLLAEAGYPDGFNAELTYSDEVRGYLPEPGPVARAIKSQLWENLNIRVDLHPMPLEEFYAAVDNGQLGGFYLLGWGADFPDVTNFLDSHFGSTATLQFGEKFSDVVTALESGAMLWGDSARQSYYITANDAIRRHVPMVPLVHGDWYFPETAAAAYRAVVQGAYASPFGFEDFSTMSVADQDSFTWMQTDEPISLYCADETDVDTLRACAQVNETLYKFSPGGAQIVPGLARSCEPDADLLKWTCHLAEKVLFHDRTTLDANDVVLSFLVQWDASHPWHVGNTGMFYYFKAFFGEFLNSAE